MKIHIDFDTLAFLMDLPDDIDLTGAEIVQGRLVLLASDQEHYPQDAVPTYGTDDDGNVSLVGFTATE